MGVNDESNKTPLHLAAEKASSKHVEALAKRMSGINGRDDLGRTPLHSAARKGQRQEIYSRIFFFFLHSYRCFSMGESDLCYLFGCRVDRRSKMSSQASNYSDVKLRNSNLTFCFERINLSEFIKKVPTEISSAF